MATRTTKIIGFSVPPATAEEIKQLARKERKTKSELFRTMFEFYRRYAPLSEAMEMAAVEQLISEAQRTPATPAAGAVREFKKLQQEGRKVARRLGIKSEEDVYRLVEEYRAGS